MKTFMEMYLECVAGDVMGPADGAAPATQFSGDTYAPGDNRIPDLLFGGSITRRGLVRSFSPKKKKKRAKK